MSLSYEPSRPQAAPTAGQTQAASVVADLLTFLEATPSPYHCAAEAARRLASAGYRRLRGGAPWRLRPGGKYFTTHAGSVVALRLGSAPQAGARIIAAHTDSPGLRLLPQMARSGSADGGGRLAVDVYGSPLLYSWFDRDLGIAGRVAIERRGRLGTRLLHIKRPVARIPSLAIHLNRGVNEQGFVVNRHLHLGAILCDSQRVRAAQALRRLLVEALGDEAGRIHAHELSLVDVQPAAHSGVFGEFIHAAGLDDRAMCHAGLIATLLASARPCHHTQVLALFDHEEVGSHTATGADGSMLGTVLRRLFRAHPEGYPRMLAKTVLLSADMGHAVHPNYPGLHDPQYAPQLNAGPIIKYNVQQRYGDDAPAAAGLRLLARRLGIRLQEYVHRPDLSCGSTLGPKVGAWLGVPVVDVGNPLLSMHSIREMCGSRDHGEMVRLMEAFLNG